MSGGTSKERGSALSKPCPPAVHFNHEEKGTQLTIVLGADMHKSSHTITRVAAATGEMLGDKTASVGARGFDQVLQWARVWASSVSGRGGLPARLGLLRAVSDRSRRTGRPGGDAADDQLGAGE